MDVETDEKIAIACGVLLVVLILAAALFLRFGDDGGNALAGGYALGALT